MGTEWSNGKGRTALATSGMLRRVDPQHAERRRNRNHDKQGRFPPNNDAGRQRGLKMSIGRQVGKLTRDELGEADADVVKDSQQLYRSTMRTLESDAAPVAVAVASACWHFAVAGYWRAQALAAGLGSKRGIECEERATTHDTRGERLMVSGIDLSQRLPKPAPPIPAWWTAPAPQTREPVPSTRQDASQDVDEGEDDADDLDAPLARLRAVQGPHGALDDDDEGGTR